VQRDLVLFRLDQLEREERTCSRVLTWVRHQRISVVLLSHQLTRTAQVNARLQTSTSVSVRILRQQIIDLLLAEQPISDWITTL
jgi:hypothetical protein